MNDDTDQSATEPATTSSTDDAWLALGAYMGLGLMSVLSTVAIASYRTYTRQREASRTRTTIDMERPDIAQDLQYRMPSPSRPYLQARPIAYRNLPWPTETGYDAIPPTHRYR